MIFNFKNLSTYLIFLSRNIYYFQLWRPINVRLSKKKKIPKWSLIGFRRFRFHSIFKVKSHRLEHVLHWHWYDTFEKSWVETCLRILQTVFFQRIRSKKKSRKNQRGSWIKGEGLTKFYLLSVAMLNWWKRKQYKNRKVDNERNSMVLSVERQEWNHQIYIYYIPNHNSTYINYNGNQNSLLLKIISKYIDLCFLLSFPLYQKIAEKSECQTKNRRRRYNIIPLKF
jgi:hypothetical protein